MRTALILLLLLGIAAIPGSLFPQRTQNPLQVKQYFIDNPSLAPWLDRFSFFEVYSSPWFSAVYLLLFISLIGCVLPRSIEHAKAIGAKPPLTPKYLDRLDHFTEIKKIDLDLAEKYLKRKGFRIRRETNSISAEKGYARESGNLLFHLSLVLVLIGVGIGSLLGSRGDAILNVGDRFINTPTSYDILGFGKFQAEDSLSPFSITVKNFQAQYDSVTNAPIDYTLTVSTANPVGSAEDIRIIKVNKPLAYGNTKIYLQAHGYSPSVVIKDKQGKVVFEGPTPFLPQDSNLSSIGAIKVPDMDPQIGFVGSFLPTADRDPVRGGFSSYPEVLDPRLLFSIWKGDLGLDSGVPQSVYRIDTSKLERIGLKALVLNESFDFGEGSITFTGWNSWVNLQIVSDPGKIYALVGAILAISGLLISLFTRQRRIWVKQGRKTEIAGLSKNEIPGLDEEIRDLVKELTGER
ncbi:MAG: cytochrome c biogenesis protein ResB [Actinomycetota bacterium]|nr:cytochrome c biogenesis protein ResB [Actinomycetota bacterium]MDA2997385.1 cytochrome c biogenesis protein ResB [Actinomycetota bacterium]